MRLKIVEDMLREYPEQIPQRTQMPELAYRLKKKYCAFHGSLPEQLEKFLVATLVHENINIIALPTDDGALETQEKAGVATAVYGTDETDSFYVPTGRLFIRLHHTEQAKEIIPELEQLGFRVVDIPNYAPYAAWVEHQSGLIHKALADFGKIHTIQLIENIEPQMLSVRSLRQ